MNLHPCISGVWTTQSACAGGSTPCTGQAMQKGIGWRKALRAAIADNPFVTGGLSPKARRELLGHSQLSLVL